MALVVSEIPYLVNKARLVEKIASLVRDKVVAGVRDIRDESDRHGMPGWWWNCAVMRGRRRC